MGSAFLAVVCAGFGALALTAAAAAAAPTQWPQATSDLAANPNVTFGTLSNGMRYAIRRNAQPAGQVSIRLVIEAGSMQETHEQEGLAHMLEHMAFRGSTHVPDGEVIKTLERLGLQFGADTNASTSAQDTVYRFDLAHPDAPSVDTGLTFMREIASELTLSQGALDSERKVVLAEFRQRDTPGTHVGLAQLQAEFPGHPFARLPIGRTDVVENATPAQLRAFYDAYYRPERAVLIVAGDVDPQAIELKIKSMFSDWHGRGPAGQDPPPFQPSGRGQSVTVDLQPGASMTTVSLAWVPSYRPRDESRAGRIETIVRGLGDAAFGRRIADMAAAAGHPFLGAGIGQYDFDGVARGVSMGASGVNDLPATISLLITAQRQALADGFTQPELDRVIAANRAALRNRLAGGFPENDTRSIAERLAGEAETGQIDLDPAQALALFEAAVQGVTVEQVNAAFRAQFSGDGPLVFFVTDTPRPPGEPPLATLLANANRATLAAYVAPTVKPWKHTDFGPPGIVAERREVSDLGVTFVRFANGVRLTVRPSKQSPGQVVIKARFGQGRLDQPRDRLDASDWSTNLLGMGGLDDLTSEDIGRTLLGHPVFAVADNGDDAFTLGTGVGGFIFPIAASDLDLETQYIAAMMTAPGWRPDGWRSLMAQAAESDRSSVTTPAGVYNRAFGALLHPGDQRWVFNTPEMRATWTPEQARAFLEPILRQGEIEVVIVGDVTPDQAIAAVAKTFGAFPKRPGVPEPADARIDTFPPPTSTPIVLRHKGRPDQAIAEISWPTTGVAAGWDDIAPTVVMTDIMRLRIIDQLRTAAGETYSPVSGAEFSWIYPTWGRVSVSVLCKPDKVGQIYATVEAIAADLAAHPVSADELNRTLAPDIETARRMQTQNGYWLAQLAGAQTDPRRLDAIRQTMPRLSRVTAADVQRVAQRWLKPDRAFRIEVLPDPSVVAAQTQPAAP